MPTFLSFLHLLFTPFQQWPKEALLTHSPSDFVRAGPPAPPTLEGAFRLQKEMEDRGDIINPPEVGRQERLEAAHENWGRVQ